MAARAQHEGLRYGFSTREPAAAEQILDRAAEDFPFAPTLLPSPAQRLHIYEALSRSVRPAWPTLLAEAHRHFDAAAAALPASRPPRAANGGGCCSGAGEPAARLLAARAATAANMVEEMAAATGGPAVVAVAGILAELDAEGFGHGLAMRWQILQVLGLERKRGGLGCDGVVPLFAWMQNLQKPRSDLILPLSARCSLPRLPAFATRKIDLWGVG